MAQVSSPFAHLHGFQNYTRPPHPVWRASSGGATALAAAKGFAGASASGLGTSLGLMKGAVAPFPGCEVHTRRHPVAAVALGCCRSLPLLPAA